MSQYNIAVIRGDGIGVDVVEEGIKVMDAVGERHGINWTWTEYPWSSDYYFKHGRMMPEDALDTHAPHSAIFFGAVGHPDVQDNITLNGLLLPIRRRLDQSICQRRSILYHGVTSPLSGTQPVDINRCVVM